MFKDKDILITQDPRNENVFFASCALHDDEEGCRAIIAIGNTKDEALKQAISSIINSCNNCIKRLEEISESICGGDLLLQIYYPPTVYILDGEEQFGNLFFCETSKLWLRDYR